MSSVRIIGGGRSVGPVAALIGPAACGDAATLRPPEGPVPSDVLHLLVVCRLGKACLIDNVEAVAG